MPTELSRRDFLRLAALTVSSIGTLAYSPFRDRLPEEDRDTLDFIKTVRVAIRKDEIWKEPRLNSTLADIRKRDEMVRVIEEFISPHGPEHNPRWYRVVGGYMHTAHLAPVETHYQRPVSRLEPGGQVFEVTVPFTQSLRFTERYGWEPLYRLYYGSNHWVIDIAEGPDGQEWYVIEDDLLHVEYMVPATHLRRIEKAEFSPITPEILDKRIEVSLADQTITCYEEGRVVLHTSVSTGIPNLKPTTNGIPTDTPKGKFNVSMKTAVRHMGDGKLTTDIHAYELPGVPWSTFFTDTGVAFHGTYWHDNYGGRMSHGCVNMRIDEAKWLYRWTTPVDLHEPGKWHTNGYGTRIEVY
jgi:lipoprotein-anchoring transpeptidase ErfK/SrfK